MDREGGNLIRFLFCFLNCLILFSLLVLFSLLYRLKYNQHNPIIQNLFPLLLTVLRKTVFNKKEMKQLTSILSFLVTLEGSWSRTSLFHYHNRSQEGSFRVYTKVHNTFFILKKAYYSLP